MYARINKNRSMNNVVHHKQYNIQHTLCCASNEIHYKWTNVVSIRCFVLTWIFPCFTFLLLLCWKCCKNDYAWRGSLWTHIIEGMWWRGLCRFKNRTRVSGNILGKQMFHTLVKRRIFVNLTSFVMLTPNTVGDVQFLAERLECSSHLKTLCLW